MSKNLTYTKYIYWWIFPSLVLRVFCILTNVVCEQDKLLHTEIIFRAASWHLCRDFCKGFDPVKKSCFAIGDTVRPLFIAEGRFCTYNREGMRESSLSKKLNKNILTPPHRAWNIAWISTQWGILYSTLAFYLSATEQQREYLLCLTSEFERFICAGM